MNVVNHILPCLTEHEWYTNPDLKDCFNASWLLAKVHVQAWVSKALCILQNLLSFSKATGKHREVLEGCAWVLLNWSKFSEWQTVLNCFTICYHAVSHLLSHNTSQLISCNEKYLFKRKNSYISSPTSIWNFFSLPYMLTSSFLFHSIITIWKG